MSSKGAGIGAKKKPVGNGGESLTKRIKIPKNFIVRPSFTLAAKVLGTKVLTAVFMDNCVLETMGIPNGSIVHVSKEDFGGGGGGVVAAVHGSGDDLTMGENVLGVSSSVRKLGGFLLGDRVRVVQYMRQPEYAGEIVVKIDAKDLNIVLEGKLKKVVEKFLDEVGIVHPTQEFDKVMLPLLPELNGGGEAAEEKKPYNLRVVDVVGDSSLESGLKKLAIDNSQEVDPGSFSSGIDTVSPPFIFLRGKTVVRLSNVGDAEVNRKYPNLRRGVTYEQIGGLGKQVSLLKSSIELPLHKPDLFSDFGIAPPRGILLHGPPGTGKTMLLRCIAQESNAHILTVNGPSIVSKYLGETENALRELFQEARRFQPSIIFMDEIDSLAPSRNSDDSGEAESRIVATLLTLMDGMGDVGRLVVVGATNRPNSVDPALRRPGRFDQEVEIGIPDVDARFEILDKQITRMRSEKSLLTQEEIKLIASKTHGYVGADLVSLCRESVLKSINRGLKSDIPQEDIKLQYQDFEETMPEIRPSAMRQIFLEMPKVYWSDIGGQKELKQKLLEVVQLPLEAADSFKKLGILAPKGVLLYGPPGCSKTLTAKALATESGLNFLAVKGPEIFNKYVGESERTIREIFRKARAASPSIIFFDEIDAISSDRDGSGTSASQNVLTSLLNEIDGVEELKGVIIVGATNRPSEIDPALLRPGRLDRHIYVAPPDEEARHQILSKRCANFNLSEQDVDLKQLAKVTEGCSGAEVALLCHEAGLAAVMENRNASKVEQRHFDKALQGISKGITQEMIDYYAEFSKRIGLSV